MLRPQKDDLWALLIVLLMVGVVVVHYGPQIFLH